jgi:LPS export ABC transporter protein LptC
MTAIVKSMGRRSVLFVESPTSEQSTEFNSLDQLRTASGKLRLQDFHRVEVKGGRSVWEVKAKDARYYPSRKVTHVNDADVVIYRGADSSVRITSRAAKLHLDETSLDRAELEGSVLVALDSDVTIETEYAVYDAAIQEITAPGKVVIKGEGYQVEGVGLDVEIDNEIVKLSDRVYSVFEPDAKSPRSFDAGSL